MKKVNRFLSCLDLSGLLYDDSLSSMDSMIDFYSKNKSFSYVKYSTRDDAETTFLRVIGTTSGNSIHRYMLETLENQYE